MQQINDVILTIATANGSGSQSANNILVRALFRLGLPVGGKNLFPSNIQGLPTWFTIRVNEQGFTARKGLADVVVAMNAQTAQEDLRQVKPDGLVLVNSEFKLAPGSCTAQIVNIPFREIVGKVTDSVKLKKLLNNMIYVGILAELLKIPESTLNEVLRHQFGKKDSLIEPNQKAIAAGRAYAQESLQGISFPHRVRECRDGNKDKVLIDGNTASAMGLVFGGCTVVAWYPITPSSSVVESFIELAEKYRVDKTTGQRNFAVVQAEDELASIAMVVGAGWAGARAITATSGPGLSLMSEAAGLAYYAEVPAVIWDVQRVGPSTGLPTRTMQGDLLKAYYLSHGDTKHVVLIPGTPGECFEFGQLAFDLAEQLQTLVIVLSDLDIGMNLHVAKKFHYPTTPMQRGKVLDADALAKAGQFHRYKDIDGDGIPYRTLPGTEHPLAAYFTRGTGHNESGVYSESPVDFRNNMERLARKFTTAAKLVPKPLHDNRAETKIGMLLYGSSHEAAAEVRHLLQQKNSLDINCTRLRALPFSPEVEEFLAAHERVYVLEQNRDAQLMSLLRTEFPQYWERCISITNFDGLPMDPDVIYARIIEHEAKHL